MRRILGVALIALATGCQASPDLNNGSSNAEGSSNSATNDRKTASNNTDGESNGSTAGTTTADGCGGDETTVALTTEDGIELAADYWPARSANRGAVILLHMIPPNWDRTSYPPRVRAGLHDLGLSVLNLDRRGAGDSGGTAGHAYEGPGGALDVQAAVSFLLSDERSCAVDRDRVMLVGASNGTTSTLDYVVGRTDLDLPDPAAIAWLSPGTYTENQYELGPQRTRLEPIPILMVHPDNEPWATQYAGEVDAWKVVEIEGGQHGTRNFDEGELEAVAYGELEAWAEAHVAP